MNLPNKLTMIRILMIPLFVVCFYLPSSWVIGTLNGVNMQWNYFIAAVIFLLAYVTDTLDGRIARAKGLVTDFGKLMDPTADKLLSSAALIMMCKFEVMSFGNFLMPVFAFVIIAREIFISGIRQLAAGKGIVIAAKAIGKAKTTLQFIAVFVTLMCGPLFRAIGIPIDFALICAAVVLTIWSGIDYTIGAKELFVER
ncbi:MAG: CDP-diacylglycerol--glycerol-3-phosphate 3-phosphatidyltransferase [Clostridium sp.]|nr:CDP-diacylglycerol--glycerol-3-phosphate 3-phosphatidyltransferase [Clostridium sp.]MDD5903744.1 CDP-diacylglycerol--glycerol-3-phosphate 3-phosphatidyltransferase [Clostridium sp.]MDD5980917.1 CDP-diacylglycerol--glycerol-3-phosphate 3-phosphatidyltransferase [Clostridium sp.]MDY5756801.1 CDP-diacylglycerol--glycerol-3-phosphate 3-phosphatidyltransferase [Eubacteriales bacterium]